MNMGLTSLFSERRLAGRISSEQFGRNPALILKNKEQGIIIEGRLTDISATGIGVSTDRELSRGQMLHLEPHGNARISDRAVVIWTRKIEESYFQAGLQLIRINTL